jgi:hypothetical protein
MPGYTYNMPGRSASKCSARVPTNDSEFAAPMLKPSNTQQTGTTMFRT